MFFPQSCLEPNPFILVQQRENCGKVLMKCDFKEFDCNLPTHSSFVSNRTKVTGTFHGELHKFVHVSPA
jgi:hypothetical protein